MKRRWSTWIFNKNLMKIKENASVSNEHYPQNPFKDYESGGIALAGCFMPRIAIAWTVGLNYVPAGAIIGLGVGLIAMAVMSRDRYQK